MPGRLFLTSLAQGVLPTGLKPPPQEQPRFNVSPGQQILTWGPKGWQHMRWGIIPVGRVNARGRPVMETLINARSETVFDKSAYEGVGRAVVPANGWYEWTGEARRKTAWRIAPKNGGLLWFAAITDIWRAPNGLEVPQVATVTCAPNKDVERIHHRMGVLLDAKDVALWLTGSAEEVAPLMVPWRNGTLKIDSAKDVDWSAP